MADKIRVGIVGATVTQGGSGWGANAHVPALKALPGYQLKAVCTSREDTAKASAAAFGADLAFHRFGDMAAFLREVRGLSSVVLWGPDEQAIAQAVVDASSGAARLAPPTTLADLLALSRAASLMVSGDTGPLHIAAAVSTPVVALFGPTDPLRNGPWSKQDEIVSRYAACGCHYQRRCHQPAWCLADVSVAEVTAAIQQRFSGLPRS